VGGYSPKYAALTVDRKGTLLPVIYVALYRVLQCEIREICGVCVFGGYPELRLRLFGVIYVALVPSAAAWGV